MTNTLLSRLHYYMLLYLNKIDCMFRKIFMTLQQQKIKLYRYIYIVKFNLFYTFSKL